MRYNIDTESLSNDLLIPKSRTKCFKSGIGGAGNYRSGSQTSPSPFDITSTLSPLTSKLPGKFSTGRGGAGNRREGSDRARVSRKNEQLHTHRREDCDAIRFHLGRGGAGNTTGLGKEHSRRRSQYSIDSFISSKSEQSSASESSIRSRFERIKEHFHYFH